MATPTLSLRTLEVSAFRSFAEPQHLELPEHGLVMVLGENGDTDGSSGSGKSSLVESLAYALGYSDYSATDLQTWSWLTEDSLHVGLQFASPDGDIVLNRGKRSSIRVGAAPAVTSATDVKSALQRVLGVRPEVLKALTYRPQKTPGLFLSMTDSEKKSFLSEVLGLQPYEAEAERVTKAISTLEAEINIQGALAERVRYEVGEAPVKPVLHDTSDVKQKLLDTERLHDLASQEADRLVAEGARLRKARAERKSAVDAQYRDRLTVAQKALADIRVETVTVAPDEELPTLRERLAFIRKGVQKFKKEHLEKVEYERQAIRTERRLYQDYLRQSAHAGMLRDECTRLAEEVATLEQESCPTCRRPWSDEEHEAKLRSARGALKAANAALANALAAGQKAEESAATIAAQEMVVVKLEATDPVPEKFAKGEVQYAEALAKAEERQRTALQTAQANHLAEVARVEAAYQALRAEYQQAVNAALAEADPEEQAANMASAKAVQDALDLERLANSLKQRIDALTAENRRVTDLHAAAEKAYQIRLVAAAAEEGKLSGIETRLAEARDYHGLIRGFLALIFDETLARVSDLTNARLARIPNVQSLTLRFSSEHENKSNGKLRQEIRPVIEKDGHVIPLKAGVSGGMYSAVELAVDLSLADVIAERTGVLPGWLVLDEAFDGLDLPAKRACMEVLREASESRLILVVDHATEMKEMFDSSIVVRSQGGKSSLLFC